MESCWGSGVERRSRSRSKVPVLGGGGHSESSSLLTMGEGEGGRLASMLREVGNGGRKSGIYSGGVQLDNRGRFREGDEEGFETGESGRVGDVNRASSLDESPFICLVGIVASVSSVDESSSSSSLGSSAPSGISA